MKQSFRIFCLTILVVLATGGAAMAAEMLNGLYCQKATIDLSAPINPETGKCPAPTKQVEGLKVCKGTTKNNQTLHLRENADGTLDIGVSVWQDGFNCGIAGKAAKTATGWRLEKFVNDTDANARCRLDITVDKKNTLVLRTDPKAMCLYACGAGISLDGVSFPLGEGRTGPARADIFAVEENVYTLPLCAQTKK
jgi:hypothetical protein